jgi:hypothetical protein
MCLSECDSGRDDGGHAARYGELWDAAVCAGFVDEVTFGGRGSTLLELHDRGRGEADLGWIRAYRVSLAI